MKTADPALIAFINANNIAWLADLYTLTLLDGTQFRWTTCDIDLPIGGNVYLSNGAVLDRTDTTLSSELEVDTLTLSLNAYFRVTPQQTLALLAADGWFDGARLQLDQVVGSRPGDYFTFPPVKAWFEGQVAGLNVSDGLLEFQVRSALDSLNQMAPRFTYSAQCGHAVYDPNCGLSKAAFSLAGATTGGTANTLLTTDAAILAKAAGYFDFGVVAFNSGTYKGYRRSVRSWDGTTLTLALSLPSAPGVGDLFTVYPGCRRTEPDCGPLKFNNLPRFRGFAHLPAPLNSQ